MTELSLVISRGELVLHERRIDDDGTRSIKYEKIKDIGLYIAWLASRFGYQVHVDRSDSAGTEYSWETEERLRRKVDHGCANFYCAVCDGPRGGSS